MVRIYGCKQVNNNNYREIHVNTAHRETFEFKKSIHNNNGEVDGVTNRKLATMFKKQHSKFVVDACNI